MIAGTPLGLADDDEGGDEDIIERVVELNKDEVEADDDGVLSVSP